MNPPGRAVTIRRAVDADTPRVTGFGRAHVARHYAPILGAEAAAGMVTQWWGGDAMGAAGSAGCVVIAELDGEVVGVAEHGLVDGEPVVWKLYVHPDHRGSGLGPRLLAAVLEQVPAGHERVLLEHVAGNVRAAAFYEREGFTVDRVDRSTSGDPAHDVVWRSRPLPVRDGGQHDGQQDG